MYNSKTGWIVLIVMLAALIAVNCVGISQKKEISNASASGSGTKEIKMINLHDMPETKKIENIDGKMLNDYKTSEKGIEVFFETKSKIRSAVIVDNGILYFGNENCEFYAVDIISKQTLWTYSTDNAVQTWPVISDNKIIFNAGNDLYILDSANGKELFKISAPSKKLSRVSSDEYAFNDSYTAVSDGIAYYTALDGSVIAADINNGKIIWMLPSKIQRYAASGVNFFDKKLYYIDYFGYLCCVDTETRQMIFRTQLNDKVFAPMYIKDGKIYAAGRNSRMYCIDANEGNVIWSSFSYDKTTWFSGGSVSIGSTLFACTSDEHTLVAFNKDNGEFLRIYPTETNAYTQPVLNGENIIVAATDVYSFRRSYIMEFDTKNHRKLWQARLDDCVLSSPAVYQGVLYFGSDSGKIYSIKL